MHPHEALITRFYEAFAKRDGEAMAACYHPDVDFSDPVFPDLHGDRARAMWKMLCGRAKELRVEFRDVRADEREGKAHWEARYNYFGRPVHNIIEAEFTFRDGLILRHRDRFDLRRWCGQALGLPGKLLGWAPFFQNAIRKKAGAGLDAFLAKESAP